VFVVGERFDASVQEIAEYLRSDSDGGALVMAQPDDFKLIKQIVSAGGHRHLIGELVDKY
jgi:hypothetical protein